MVARPWLAVFFVLATGASTLPADDVEFKKTGLFQSVDALIAAAHEFQPASSRSDLAPLFPVPEIGQPEDPSTGKPVPATTIEDVAISFHAFPTQNPK